MIQSASCDAAVDAVFHPWPVKRKAGEYCCAPAAAAVVFCRTMPSVVAVPIPLLVSCCDPTISSGTAGDVLPIPSPVEVKRAISLLEIVMPTAPEDGLNRPV